MPLPVSEKIKNNNPFIEIIYQTAPNGFTGYPRCRLLQQPADNSPDYNSDICVQSKDLTPIGDFVNFHFEFQEFIPRMPLPCKECSVLASFNGPPVTASTPKL